MPSPDPQGLGYSTGTRLTAATPTTPGTDETASAKLRFPEGGMTERSAPIAARTLRSSHATDPSCMERRIMPNARPRAKMTAMLAALRGFRPRFRATMLARPVLKDAVAVLAHAYT